LMRQLDIKGLDLYDLSISDITKITNALHRQGESQKLQILSPTSGVILLPTKSDENGGANKKLEKGDPIKQSDVLAVVGDSKALSVRIAINEFDINQIAAGQPVKVTSTAFPDVVLQGSILGVDHQA